MEWALMGKVGGVVMGVLVKGTEGGRWEIVERDKRGGAVSGEGKAGELMSKVIGKLMRECWGVTPGRGWSELRDRGER